MSFQYQLIKIKTTNNKKEIKLSTIPAFNISFDRICPLLKAIALGGVLIGNIKSQLADKVTGIAKYIGSMPLFTANAATTGTNKVTIAKLLIKAVSNKPMPVKTIKYKRSSK